MSEYCNCKKDWYKSSTEEEIVNQARAFVRNNSTSTYHNNTYNETVSNDAHYEYSKETKTADADSVTFESSYSGNNDYQNFTTSYSADTDNCCCDNVCTNCGTSDDCTDKNTTDVGYECPREGKEAVNVFYPGNTSEEFQVVINQCRDIFIKKLSDYGASWRIMRPESVTDQIYIKANRIRSLQEKNGVTLVGEGIMPEFMAIVNYGIVGLIQLELGYSKFGSDISADIAMEHYDKWIQLSYDLMMNKNHDYDEAWRLMRMHSFTDLILAKLFRTMQIEENHGETLISEGVDANYLDMINYAIFALIKFNEYENQK